MEYLDIVDKNDKVVWKNIIYKLIVFRSFLKEKYINLPMYLIWKI